VCIVGCLTLEDAVDGNDKIDKLANSLVTFFRSELAVGSDPFQLIKDGVLGFLFPVEEEYVLEQRRKVLIRLDALPIMQLRKKLDVQRQCQHGLGAFPKHHLGDVVRSWRESVAWRHFFCN